MSTEKSYSITTDILLQMQTAIIKNDVELFRNLMTRKHQLSNCSCGDSYLQQAIQKVYAQAIQKFIIEK